MPRSWTRPSKAGRAPPERLASADAAGAAPSPRARRLRGALLALTLLLPGLVAPATAGAGTAGGDPFRDALLRELNRARAARDLPPVRADRGLGSAATRHSRDMARRSYIAHGAWASRVKAASGRARSVGEVIGWTRSRDAAGEAAWMVRSWLDSPTHRAIVLGRGFRRVGVGRATRVLAGGAADAIYTADFASAR